MRRIFVQFGTGYCGEDGADVFEINDDASDLTIEEISEEIAREWAESYGRYEDEDDYLSIFWTWTDYEPEKHDQLRAGGGSFEEDFE